eukprot:COSAG05_NODE_4331_length_1563_cov_3.361339_2_plen_41_part_01
MQTVELDGARGGSRRLHPLHPIRSLIPELGLGTRAYGVESS